MIKLKDVTVSFDDGRGSFDAVDDFSYEFADRGLYFVTGESGAGKSTLLNAIGGLQKITSGEVSSPKGTAFSYVFQDEGLLFSLSLLDNLRLVEEDEAKIRGALERVGLGNKLHEPVSLLSKGERARLSIARALLSRSSAILLDEPTGNLDSRNAAMVYGLLSSVSRERLVVVVSHDEAAAERYGDAVLHMKDGRLVEEEALRPLPEGGPSAAKPQDPRIPWRRAGPAGGGAAGPAGGPGARQHGRPGGVPLSRLTRGWPGSDRPVTDGIGATGPADVHDDDEEAADTRLSHAFHRSLIASGERLAPGAVPACSPPVSRADPGRI